MKYAQAEFGEGCADFGEETGRQQYWFPLLIVIAIVILVITFWRLK
jgi:hypothetical protein